MSAFLRRPLVEVAPDARCTLNAERQGKRPRFIGDHDVELTVTQESKSLLQRRCFELYRTVASQRELQDPGRRLRERRQLSGNLDVRNGARWSISVAEGRDVTELGQNVELPEDAGVGHHLGERDAQDARAGGLRRHGSPFRLRDR